MQPCDVPPAFARQDFDSRHRQRRQSNPDHVVPGQFAESQPDGVGRGELVVTIRGDEHRAGALYAPADEAHEIESGLVRPVQVLEDEDGHALGLGQIVEQSTEQQLRRFPMACERATERRALCGDLPYRGECAWRGKGIARSPERARVASVLRDEAFDQRALAEPGLPGDEHECTGA